MEIWKDIPNYEGLYQISNLGRVRGIDRKVHYRDIRNRNIKSNLKKLTLNKKGYLKVTLYKNNKSQTTEVQRLVAQAFVQNEENKEQVNHINGITTDNRVENLEWCTPKENSLHRVNVLKHGLVGVNQFDLNGKYIKTYESVKQAAQENGIKPCGISNVINCRRNTAGGYYWALI